MTDKPITTNPCALLRSAVSRIRSAQQWAVKFGLTNVGADLGVAATEISKAITAIPERKKDDGAA